MRIRILAEAHRGLLHVLFRRQRKKVAENRRLPRLRFPRHQLQCMAGALADAHAAAGAALRRYGQRIFVSALSLSAFHPDDFRAFRRCRRFLRCHHKRTQCAVRAGECAIVALEAFAAVPDRHFIRGRSRAPFRRADRKRSVCKGQKRLRRDRPAGSPARIVQNPGKRCLRGRILPAACRIRHRHFGSPAETRFHGLLFYPEGLRCFLRLASQKKLAGPTPVPGFRKKPVQLRRKQPFQHKFTVPAHADIPCQGRSVRADDMDFPLLQSFTVLSGKPFRQSGRGRVDKQRSARFYLPGKMGVFPENFRSAEEKGFRRSPSVFRINRAFRNRDRGFRDGTKAGIVAFGMHAEEPFLRIRQRQKLIRKTLPAEFQHPQLRRGIRRRLRSRLHFRAQHPNRPSFFGGIQNCTQFLRRHRSRSKTADASGHGDPRTIFGKSGRRIQKERPAQASLFFRPIQHYNVSNRFRERGKEAFRTERTIQVYPDESDCPAFGAGALYRFGCGRRRPPHGDKHRFRGRVAFIIE